MSDNLSNKNVSESKLQEINNLYMLIEKENRKNAEYKMLLDSIVECLIPNYGISESICVKIKDIILREELVNLLPKQQNETTSDSQKLIDEFNNLELSVEEQKCLKAALEQRLKEKGDTFLKNNIQEVDKIIEHIKLDVETEKTNIFLLEQDVIDAQKINLENLQEICDKLNELAMIKLENALQTAEQKVSESHDKMEHFHLKQRLFQSKLSLSIFNELPITMTSYRKALKDLKEQQKEYANEISKVEHEIENYETVEMNEEFQEILKDFKQYQRAIENQMWIHKEMAKK